MQNISLSENFQGLIVRPDAARRQLDAESKPVPSPDDETVQTYDENAEHPNDNCRGAAGRGSQTSPGKALSWLSQA